uniref:Ubiquitinyl hydrolase variant UBP zinc finger domain-containing protein n=1 Tax=Nelumbo nucifera TaxID=4432 RepID=A0A822ZH14_NELNU|nr:TPA_asm: hypothetical protein HUJ06_003624 [Nelumbo nucifera]
MNSFLAFGKDYVGWNYGKTGNPVYLHIKQTKKPVPEDRPLKKPTVLAIGIYLSLYTSMHILKKG